MVTDKKLTLNTLKALTLVGLTTFAMACGGGESTPATTTVSSAAAENSDAAAAVAGLITADDVNLGPIDQGMVAKGKELYDLKCQACHSLGTNRVVGPGWQGVADQRKPEWIMNMIVHTDAMLENDAEAQAMREEGLLRMPNQNPSKNDVRNVLEFMRSLEKKPA